MNGLLARETFETLGKLRDDGVTILIVEQNAMMTLRLADRAYVLEHGRVTLHGPAGELAEDPRIRKAYLGLETAAPEPAPDNARVTPR